MIASPQALYDYTDQHANPAGLHRELWYHEQGDRSWLVVTRNTVTAKCTGRLLPTCRDGWA